MRDLGDEFDKIFRADGGRLAFSSLNAGLRPFCNQYLDVFRSVATGVPDRRNIYVDFIDNDAFNAIACCRGANEFIGIYLGATLRLQIYFNAFMSDPEVFPDTGLDLSEGVNQETMDLIRTGMAGFDAKSNQLSVPVLKPKNRSRQTIANHMNLIACLMLLFHELAHLTRGHLLYLRDELGMTNLDELPMRPISERESRLRKILEVDADRCSVMTGLAALPLISDIVPEIKEADELTIWGACNLMLYCVMDQLSLPHQINKNSTHPSVWARFVANDYAVGTSEHIPKGSGARMDAGARTVMDWWERHKLPSSIRLGANNAIKEQEDLDVDYFVTVGKLEKYEEERLRNIMSI